MKKLISGKVREIYEISDQELVIVTTDRISAFDVILNSTIKDKGIVLNLISLYWFDYTRDIIPNHIISDRLSDMPAYFSENPAQFDRRTVLVKKLRMLPWEFVVRGYMFGSMWKEYQASQSFCGQRLREGYRLAEKLAEPVVTPSAKNSAGHDEYVPLERLRRELGAAEADRICAVSLQLYRACFAQALKKGIIVADTKFEFGYDENGALVLGDEIFTPDSSRFWAADDYRAGISPKSYDKQFVRDWLTERGLNGVTPAPALPQKVADATAGLYRECCRRITGRELITTNV
ncbi:MAG: phosphoribosylaminoimidazolesuccinocarboxamide synthase [Lachnospiraceae bacterium]|nr:phosphoribosylaminoimidazolesuccinocarboxamide synthase [Lachnospiraceae bacterium]